MKTFAAVRLKPTRETGALVGTREVHGCDLLFECGSLDRRNAVTMSSFLFE